MSILLIGKDTLILENENQDTFSMLAQISEQATGRYVEYSLPPGQVIQVTIPLTLQRHMQWETIIDQSAADDGLPSDTTIEVLRGWDFHCSYVRGSTDSVPRLDFAR